jgi:uncharacterized MnhB-related membrane protein
MAHIAVAIVLSLVLSLLNATTITILDPPDLAAKFK